MRRIDAYTIFLTQEFAGSLFLQVIFTASALYQVQTVGLNPLQLVLVGTAVEATAFLAEVPTGIIADMYSRRLSVILGFLLIGVGFLIEGSLPFFVSILAAQVVLGIGFTCMSGALEAWIADEVGEEKAGRAFLRAAQFGQAGALAGIAVSVLLGRAALNIPILVGGALLIALGLFLALFMPETGFRPRPREERNSFQQMGHTFGEGMALVRGSRVLLMLLAAAALFGAFSEGFDRLWTPHLLSFDLPYFEPIVWFGLINGVTLLLGIAATEFVNRRVDTKNQLLVSRVLQWVLALVIAGVVAFGLAWNYGVALMALLAVKPLRSMNYPLATAWMNQHLEPGVRATVFSIRNQADALGQMLGGPMLGAIATLVSLRVEMVVAALLLIPALYLYGRPSETSPVPTSVQAEGAK